MIEVVEALGYQFCYAVTLPSHFQARKRPAARGLKPLATGRFKKISEFPVWLNFKCQEREPLVLLITD